MHVNLTSRLDAGSYVVLDGALATELERRGADLGGPLWSARLLADQPELIRAVHLDYFRAGAEVAITASYQASAKGLQEHGYSTDEARDLILRSVSLAKEARDLYVEASSDPRPLFIAGSVGCYGAYLADGSEFRGHYGVSRDVLMDFHRPRIEWLIEAGVDVLACETIPCGMEAEALAKLLPEYASTPAWVSFSCDDAGHVREGQAIELCAAAVHDVDNVIAIGVNCTSPMHVLELLDRLRATTDKPLVAYPNSGETWNPDRRAYENDPACSDFGAAAIEWRDHGARLIGGCCRTTPEDIRAIAVTLRKKDEPNRFN